jgi:zinc protease
MKRITLLLIALFVSYTIYAEGDLKKAAGPIQEFDLPNGLHVIISPDTTSPVVCVGMMYHVGSKNENPSRTGFAHLFEHLLFFGTKNIPEKTLDVLIRSVGGYANASTCADRTYYYTILPANQCRLGLWIEAERLYHPIMTQEAINREREVVKEESRQRFDGTPMGRIPEDMLALEYKTCSLRWPVVGSMDHLSAANLSDFQEFFKKFYVPNNACLILTGNVNIEDARAYINAYFNRIPRGADVVQPVCNDKASGKEEIIEKSLKGIDNPHIVISYTTVPQMERDAKILEFISSYLGLAKEGLFNLNDKKTQEKAGITKIGITNEFYEIAGSLWIRASYKDSLNYRKVLNAIDSEIARLGNGLDPLKMAQVKAAYESGYVNLFYDSQFLGETLGMYHFLWGDAHKLYGITNEYLSITNEELMAAVKKYLIPANRRVIVYNTQK